MPNQKKIHIYGPVPSRRLGFSLGVDILPFKTCSMNCIYCQLGAGSKTTVRRKEYIPADDVLDQIKNALARGPKIEAITFSGSGEPTLHSGIGKIIRQIKKMTKIPIVVLTNSSGLTGKKGREDLLGADIVVPSLDAVTPEVFSRINRPHPRLTVEKIVDGLIKFRQEFAGQLWLEVMLVKGVNDGLGHLKKLKETIGRIKPDRVQLNTVVRPPAERYARPLGHRELEKIKTFLGRDIEIIADFKPKEKRASPENIRSAILATVRRRPVTARDISLSLGKPLEEVSKHLSRLLKEKKVKAAIHKGSTYFKPAPSSA
jgi:wyosine [tRNA(Phe)-imidazoG37] synthetase (radical SAM superfamily)